MSDSATTGGSTTGVLPYSLELGEPCTPPQKYCKIVECGFEENQPCKAGLFCAGTNDCDLGYCMKVCDPMGDPCEAVDGVEASCGEWFPGGPNVCRFFCGPSSTGCPINFAQELVCDIDACVPPAAACPAE